MTDCTYTNGVIAVKEKRLLGGKLVSFCEMSAEEVFRSLSESGYGGAEAASVSEYEKLIEAEEASLDAFIREYVPSDAELQYFFAPRDFHNAKALLKAEVLGIGAENMLAPEGCVPIETLAACMKDGNLSALPERLRETAERGKALLEQDASGAKLGTIFEQGLFSHLTAACRKNKTLKALLAARADTGNILVAMRSKDEESAKESFVPGGTLSKRQIQSLFEGEERALNAFENSPYLALVRSCFKAKANRLPYSEGERMAESVEADYFARERYMLEGRNPFFSYVLRRRNENANVRILFVCLLAGMPAEEIKKRLRSF